MKNDNNRKSFYKNIIKSISYWIIITLSLLYLYDNYGYSAITLSEHNQYLSFTANYAIAVETSDGRYNTPLDPTSDIVIKYNTYLGLKKDILEGEITSNNIEKSLTIPTLLNITNIPFGNIMLKSSDLNKVRFFIPPGSRMYIQIKLETGESVVHPLFIVGKVDNIIDCEFCLYDKKDAILNISKNGKPTSLLNNDVDTLAEHEGYAYTNNDILTLQIDNTGENGRWFYCSFRSLYEPNEEIPKEKDVALQYIKLYYEILNQNTFNLWLNNDNNFNDKDDPVFNNLQYVADLPPDIGQYQTAPFKDWPTRYRYFTNNPYSTNLCGPSDLTPTIMQPTDHYQYYCEYDVSSFRGMFDIYNPRFSVQEDLNTRFSSSQELLNRLQYNGISFLTTDEYPLTFTLTGKGSQGVAPRNHPNEMMITLNTSENLNHSLHDLYLDTGFRFFIPPGTNSLRITAYMSRDNHTPLCVSKNPLPDIDYDTYMNSRANHDSFSDFFNDPTGYWCSSGGGFGTTSGSFSEITEGFWLYFKVFCFPNSPCSFQDVELYFTVNVETYMSWFENTNWDLDNNPIYTITDPTNPDEVITTEPSIMELPPESLQGIQLQMNTSCINGCEPSHLSCCMDPSSCKGNGGTWIDGKCSN